MRLSSRPLRLCVLAITAAWTRKPISRKGAKAQRRRHLIIKDHKSVPLFHDLTWKIEQMHVECYGSGSRVYFGLHGWSGNHATFAPLAAYLPAGVTLHSAGFPGYRRSPAPPRWELDAITDEIERAIAAVGSPVTVIGNCSGAVFALLAAERVSRSIERLILIDPFAYLPWYFKIFLHKRIGRYAYYSTFANPVGRWLTNLSLSKHRAADTNLTESFVSVS